MIPPFVNVAVLYSEEDSEWQVVVDDSEADENIVHGGYDDKSEAEKEARQYAKKQSKSQLQVRTKRDNVVGEISYD